MLDKGDRVIYTGSHFLKDRRGKYARVIDNSKKGLVKIRFFDGYQTRVKEKLLKKEGL